MTTQIDALYFDGLYSAAESFLDSAELDIVIPESVYKKPISLFSTKQASSLLARRKESANSSSVSLPNSIDITIAEGMRRFVS